jgi:hypothetical protein
LSLIADENGDSTYSVDWDGSLELNIENADGSITTIAADEINNYSETVQAWFGANSIDDQWTDGIASGFQDLGNTSIAATALMSGVDASTVSDVLISNFTISVDKLLDSELQVGGLMPKPDQTTTYALMPGEVTRTTLYDERLGTPALINAGVSGDLYFFTKNGHKAEDYSGGTGEYITPMESKVTIDWHDDFGLQLNLNMGNGNTLLSNHASSNSIMNLLESMLISDSSSRLSAGLQFGTMGDTGVGTGIHNHLVANGGRIAPSVLFEDLEIPINSEDGEVLLTGHDKETPYNDPELISQILLYRDNHEEFDTSAYVSAHEEDFRPYWEDDSLWLFDSNSMSYQNSGFSSSEYSFYDTFPSYYSNFSNLSP